MSASEKRSHSNSPTHTSQEKRRKIDDDDEHSDCAMESDSQSNPVAMPERNHSDSSTQKYRDNGWNVAESEMDMEFESLRDHFSMVQQNPFDSSTHEQQEKRRKMDDSDEHSNMDMGSDSQGHHSVTKNIQAPTSNPMNDSLKQSCYISAYPDGNSTNSKSANDKLPRMFGYLTKNVKDRRDSVLGTNPKYNSSASEFMNSVSDVNSLIFSLRNWKNRNPNSSCNAEGIYLQRIQMHLNSCGHSLEIPKWENLTEEDLHDVCCSLHGSKPTLLDSLLTILMESINI